MEHWPLEAEDMPDLHLEGEATLRLLMERADLPEELREELWERYIR